MLVGLHTDEDVMKRRGPHMPIMNLHERSLSVLACKYVDEVIIGMVHFCMRGNFEKCEILGVTPIISGDLLKTFNISLVVRGSQSEFSKLDPEESEARYSVAQSRGIFKVLESPSTSTTRSLIKRIVENHAMFSARNSKKAAQEMEYYSNEKEYVQEI